MKIDSLLPIFQELSKVSQSLNLPVYLVGGVLRDYFLDLLGSDLDLDFTVVGQASLLANALSQELNGQVKEYLPFATAKLVLEQNYHGISEIDFVSARSEEYKQAGSLPSIKLADLNADLRRRDFSINTIAIAVSDLVRIISAGLSKEVMLSAVVAVPEAKADLQAKTIRILHKNSFIDDPTRILRASRYLVRIGGNIESETEQQLLSALAGNCLTTISKERLLRDLGFIFSEVDPRKILKQLNEWRFFEATNWCSESELEIALQLIFDQKFEKQLDFEFFKFIFYNAVSGENKQLIADRLLIPAKLIKSWKRVVPNLDSGKALENCFQYIDSKRRD